MILRSISIRSFRCISQLHVDFNTGLNILYGPNEFGKSTLVEALRAAFLLPVNSKVAEDFVPWGTDDTPEVVVEFELSTLPKAERAGTQSATARWRISKSFGRGRNQTAVLERVTEHGRSVEKSRGRDVDEQLRDLLGWGIQGPGGRRAPRGWPQSYLVTALLGDQDSVAKIFETSLDADGTDSGRDRLTAALGVLAQAPEVTTLLDRLYLRTREAFTEKGQKRRTPDSPLVKITDRKREQHRCVENLESEEFTSQEINNKISELRKLQQKSDEDVTRLDREVELLTHTLAKRQRLEESRNLNAKRDEHAKAYMKADEEYRTRNTDRVKLESKLQAAIELHGQAKEHLASIEARLKQLTETRRDVLESRQRQIDADRKTAQQRRSNAQRVIAAVIAVEEQRKEVAASLQEVEAGNRCRVQATVELRRALQKDIELVEEQIAIAEATTNLARLTVQREDLSNCLLSAAEAEREFKRLNQATTDAENVVGRLKSDRVNIQIARNESLGQAKRLLEQRQERAGQRRQLEDAYQKAEAAEQRARSYLTAVDRFNEVEQRLSVTQQKQLALNSERDTYEQNQSTLTIELEAVTRSASLGLLMTAGCAIGALSVMILTAVVSSGHVALFSIAGTLAIGFVVLGLRWRGLSIRCSQVSVERDVTRQTVDRLLSQALVTDSELSAAQRELDACRGSLPNELLERFASLDVARSFLHEKLPLATEKRTRMEQELATLDPPEVQLEAETNDGDSTAGFDAKLHALSTRLASAEESAREIRKRRDQAETRLEQARQAISSDDLAVGVLDIYDDGETRLQRLDFQIAQYREQLGWSETHPVPTVNDADREEAEARRNLVAATTKFNSRQETFDAVLTSDLSGDCLVEPQAVSSPVLSVDEADQQWRAACAQQSKAEDELKYLCASLNAKHEKAEQMAQELENPVAEQLAEADQVLVRLDAELAELDSDADNGIEGATIKCKEAQKATSHQEQQVLALKLQLEGIGQEIVRLQDARDVVKTARDKAEENAGQLDAESIATELARCADLLANEGFRLEVSNDQLERSRNQQAQAVAHQRRVNTSLHEARGNLKSSGGDVLREKLELARAELMRIETEAAELELEYDAMYSLQETLQHASQKHSAHLGKSLAQPLSAQFAALTNHRYANLQIGNSLDLKTITAGASERTPDSMSVGTRHQLATLIRLLLAAQLQTTVVLDDQLVHSDAERLRWFRDLLRRSVVDSPHQVIIFTCRPLDYVAEHEFVEAGRSRQDSLQHRVNIVDLSEVKVGRLQN